MGVKKPSDLTVYVSPELANEIGMWNTLGNGGKRVAISDGKLVLMSRDLRTGKTGRDRVYADAAFSTEPRVGLHPVELWDKSEAGQVYSSNHPGNRIVSMGQDVLWDRRPARSRGPEQAGLTTGSGEPESHVESRPGVPSKGTEAKARLPQDHTGVYIPASNPPRANKAEEPAPRVAEPQRDARRCRIG